jgi:hypothetical protein
VCRVLREGEIVHGEISRRCAVREEMLLCGMWYCCISSRSPCADFSRSGAKYGPLRGVQLILIFSITLFGTHNSICAIVSLTQYK